MKGEAYPFALDSSAGDGVSWPPFLGLSGETAKKQLFGLYLCAKNCVIIKVSKGETLCEF